MAGSCSGNALSESASHFRANVRYPAFPIFGPIQTMHPFKFFILLVASLTIARADYAGWSQSGSLFILTTSDGADLPASASVENFPLLVRLHKDTFDFTKAKPAGEDLRFSTPEGVALSYQIEHWDAAQGDAAVWVKIPKIVGTSRQEIKLHWGKPDAASESNGAAVFGETNGFVSVWHLGETVVDEVGTLTSKDVGTTTVPGMVGKARHLAGKQGVFGGDKIPNYPNGASDHSTSTWFRAERPNSTIIGWGNEGGGRGSKVRMQFRSPPHIHIDSDFSDVDAPDRLPMHEWIHVVHTYTKGEGKIYLNGKLAATEKPMLDIKTPSRLWLGGWYNNYDFVGDLDEVRISKVTRSANWVRLEFENQKPLQTLVGPVVAKGNAFSVSQTKVTVDEGKSVTITAEAGGAQKWYWILKRNGSDEVVAVDRTSFTFESGRVVGDASAVLQLRAIDSTGVKTKDITIDVKDSIPEPQFTLQAPAAWDGRKTVEVVPVISNLEAMKAKGAGELKYTWTVSGGAVIKEVAADRLLLKRSQYSGFISIKAVIQNGGAEVSKVVNMVVTEPKSDPWVQRVPDNDEKPEDGQFYARDDKNEGTLIYNGTLDAPAESVFLRVLADDKPYKLETQKPTAERGYRFAIKLKPGLIKYKVEFGTKAGGKETLLHTVSNLVCGDAFIIDGQSNALATDTGEKSPLETSEWIRSYGRPQGDAKGPHQNLWCLPVWKAGKDDKAELGWWGMELAKGLVASQKVPIFIVNAAVGGTRIDVHQRNEADPTDLSTIYGRMLWRVQQAKLTHGIRGILWHQGENDQGSDGPTGGYGWETYHPYFVEMAGAWKRDFPNVQHYHIFQIWPNSCSMGGRNGSGDMLREKQRTLPMLFSKMTIMSTLGIQPPGGCHFPLIGWAQFANLVQPQMEQVHYGRKFDAPVSAANLQRASVAGDTVRLEFDQPVLWQDTLAGQFYLDGEKDKVASGSVSGNVLTLKLKEPTTASKITYLKEIAWSQDKLLMGANGIAALTFCNVVLEVGNNGVK